MVFATSLVTAVGAAYLFQKSERSHPTLAIACVPIELISLVLLLVTAPWQIHLILLLAVLASYRFVRTRWQS